LDDGDETERERLDAGGMWHMNREDEKDAGGGELAATEGACVVEARN